MTAARDLFRKQPWQIVSMNDVAAEAGLTRRTLYNQFATAEDLYRATREDLILEVAKFMPLSVAGRFSPQATLRTYFSMLADAFADPTYMELLTSIVRDGDSAPWFVEAYNRHIRVPVVRSIELYIQALPAHPTIGVDSRREALNLLAMTEAIALTISSLSGFDRMSPELAKCTSDFVDGFLTRMGCPASAHR